MTAPTCATCRYYDHPTQGHYSHCWWGRYHLRPKWDEPVHRVAVLVTPDDGRVCHTWESPDAQDS